MGSRTDSTSSDGTSSGEGGDTRQLISHAAQLARVTPAVRGQVRALIRSLHRAEPYDEPDDPTIPPQIFIDALRKPRLARRKPIVVQIDGKRIPLLLNPRGEADPEREQYLWGYLRELVHKLSTEAAA